MSLITESGEHWVLHATTVSEAGIGAGAITSVLSTSGDGAVRGVVMVLSDLGVSMGGCIMAWEDAMLSIRVGRRAGSDCCSWF